MPTPALAWTAALVAVASILHLRVAFAAPGVTLTVPVPLAVLVVLAAAIAVALVAGLQGDPAACRGEEARMISVRARRRITRLSVAVSFLCLLAAVMVPAVRHRTPAGGWLICVSATVGVVAGLAYLHSTRTRP